MPETGKSTNEDIPPGFTLRHTLRGHSGWISRIAWSPSGRLLSSPSADQTIGLWDAQTGQYLRTLEDHSSVVVSVAWSPDGKILASGSGDQTIRLWDAQTGRTQRTLEGHFGEVYCVAWSPDGKTLASGSEDNTIRLWNPNIEKQIVILEGHTRHVNSVSFSNDGCYLASKSSDETVRLWRTSTWETIAILEEPSDSAWPPSVAFNPNAPLLATLGENNTVIRIWGLDYTILLGAVPVTPSFHYTNAKVVLIGDSGVGKSGLGLVLTGQPFLPTESTHGRHVWTFDDQEVALGNQRKETRQTLLWDLAGQPGYRLIHQLHLNEVAVALVLFDARSETDPFAGVYHWDRALRQAQRIQSNSALPLKKFLVAARIDRGGRDVSLERIESLVRELGFDGYFETSAKEDIGIEEVAGAVKQAIDWSMLPKVTSNDLFQHIKDFLLSEKEAGHLLSTSDDLYRTFLKSPNAPDDTEELRAQFETCIGRVESRDLIRRLSFGNLVLLQPELLDSFASALVNAVKAEPDGLGSILEEKARTGAFSVPREERLKDKEQEKLLLIAMVEDLLRHEIVLREQADEGTYLVFPSQSTRANPDLPDPEGKAVIFDFEGPVQNIFATLAVRLSHSGVFKKKDTWKDAVTFSPGMGGSCGMFLHNIGEGHAELTLFYDKKIGAETRFYFEEYVHTHLQRRAIAESIKLRRIFVCSECGEPFTESQVRRRREAGFDSIRCNVCETQVSIIEKEGQLTPLQQAVVQEMDRVADAQRELSAAASKLQGKIATGDFDVFLCHNTKAKLQVKVVGEKLKEQGILPWLDEWELPPGLSWQQGLEKQIKRIKSVAVFVGKDGMGPWQQKEVEAFLIKFANRNCPIIPILLPDASRQPRLPIFLQSMTWVDFRKQDPDPMKQLIWGITGKREEISDFV